MESHETFRKAVSLVWEHSNASTSFLQRHLGIGYNAAARLIERMEEMAIVSKPNHVGKREVRSPDELRRSLSIRDDIIEIAGGDENQAKVILNAIMEGFRALQPDLSPDQVAAMTARKPDPKSPEFQVTNDHNYGIAADELRQFIERFEQLETEKKNVSEQQKELMAEAKGRGYDTKVMRKVIALRKRSADDVAEENAILELYCDALGVQR